MYEIVHGNAFQEHCNYDDGQFQLLLTSTPYPGVAGFDISGFDYIATFLPRFLSLWLPKMDRRGVVVQNVMFPKRQGYWFDIALFEIPAVYEAMGMQLINPYIWDKLNSSLSGNHHHDRNAWEFCFAFAFREGHKNNPVYRPYSTKTVGKSLPGNRTRGADVRGSMAGGHSRLNPNGARQDNVLRMSSSGDQNRPRVRGGSFPRGLAERFILQYSDPGDWIVDPFAGSFTTVKVGHELGRRAVGIDIDETAVAVGRKWLGEN